MKVGILYLRIVKKSDPKYPVLKNYEESTVRFADTYRKFKPEYPHDLIIINCGHYRPDDSLDDIAARQVTAISSGYDNGTYQEGNSMFLDYDLLIGMNTHCYFWRADWLEKLVNAAKQYGPGVYGPSASCELEPHLRSPCLAWHPSVLCEYPMWVRDRGQCCLFEHGPDNFSMWAHRRGFPSMMVTADGKCWARNDWRTPPNIFRRGDQTNVLVFDRHTDIYAAASPEEKQSLGRAADGQ